MGQDSALDNDSDACLFDLNATGVLTAFVGASLPEVGTADIWLSSALVDRRRDHAREGPVGPYAFVNLWLDSF